MQKRFLIVALTTFLLCFSCVTLHAQNKTVSYNERVPTHEVGAQIFSFHGHDLGFGWCAGSRFTYNLNNNIAFDSEVNLSCRTKDHLTRYRASSESRPENAPKPGVFK